MIPQNDILHWSQTHPWKTANQVEQDLLLSQGICEIYADALLAEELVATKLRALYQRSKGRDLFDIWLALTILEVDPSAVVAAFPTYRPDGLTQEQMRANLEAKLMDHDFCHDCDQLVAEGAESLNYNPQDAGVLVGTSLLSLL